MDKIEEKILNTIDAHREEIIKIGRDIWEHAECGYKEVRTSRLFQDHMKKLGLSVENGLAITGAKAYQTALLLILKQALPTAAVTMHRWLH